MPDSSPPTSRDIWTTPVRGIQYGYLGYEEGERWCRLHDQASIIKLQFFDPKANDPLRLTAYYSACDIATARRDAERWLHHEATP